MVLGTCLAVMMAASVGAGSQVREAALKPKDLRCEYRVEPLGVDALHPRLSWVLGGEGAQTAYRILVSSTREQLRKNGGDLWDTGTVSGSRQNNISYGGKPLESGRTYFWKVAVWAKSGKPVWSAPATFETGLLKATDWKARWIDDGKPVPTSEADFYKDDPAPIFRKEFHVRGPVTRARLYVTGLGYCEPSLNGERIGDRVLDPGWTRYDKRTAYNVYDLTKSLKEGSNCLAAMVGNGWYNPLPLKLFGTFNVRNELPTGRPRLIAQLHIEYRDGSTQTVVTDPTWKVGESAIQHNSIFLGEVVDARKESPGWNRPGFDDSGWRRARLAPTEIGTLQAQSQPPIRATKSWKAVAVTTPKPGVYLYDMGVNFAGWASFQLNLPAGSKLQMRYGELKYPDGNLNPMTSVAGQIKREGVGGPGAPAIAWQTDTYITKGGKETYTPRFTFHGFRYVEITGLDKPLPLNAVTAHRLHSDVEEAGSFECSNPMLNDIQTICRRTFLSNIFSVQSDCPHRERLGYGGDIVATSEAFMLNYNMAGFYEKAVRDFSDSSRPDGMFTDTAPFIGIQYCGVIWAMAHPLLVDQLYRYYGDREIGAQEYPAAKRWMGLVEQKYPDGIVTEGLSDHEALTPNPSPDLVTPMYFECAKLLASTADRLGKQEDATRFRALAAKIQAAYNRRFVDRATGKVGPGTQASQSIALYTGILEESSRQPALRFLLADIEKRNGHLSTGILGTKFMLDVLSREGHADVAYRIVTQPDFPGWGWMLKNGATTLWEHWEFSDNTFSHNHPMFGSVSQWMINWLGGIQAAPEADGFDRIHIRPQTPAGLDWVKSSYQSVRGKIVSNWERKNGKTTFEVVIPANTRAEVTLPAKPGQAVTLNGRRQTAGPGPISLGSGSYRLTLGE